MKKFFVSFVLIISLLFNVFADNKQAHKELREAFENYGLLPELIEKGFSLDKLGELETGEEFRDYLKPFFLDENNYPLDNHAMLSMIWDRQPEKGPYVYKITNISESYTQFINWSDEYGSKNELLKKGYKEDEIFYYPYFNGEWRDGYRVGKKFMGKSISAKQKESSIIETKNSFYLKLNGFDAYQYIYDYIDKVGFSKKKYLILNLTDNIGGDSSVYDHLLSKINKMNPKKVFVLISPATFSCGEWCAFSIKELSKKDVTIIGSPTCGATSIGGGRGKHIEFENGVEMQISLCTRANTGEYGALQEGIGIPPDIYTSNNKESIEVVKYLTKDFELNIE